MVRQAPVPRVVRIQSKPYELDIDVARSAWVVIDMQNDFCHPEGWFGQKGVDVSPMRAPIPVLQEMLPLWRTAGGRVVWLNWGIRADRINLPPMVQFAGKRARQAVGYGEVSPRDHGPSVVRGAWGAAVVDELEVGAEDVTVFKHRLSGFWDNECDSVLRALGVQTLFFSGVNTDRCVFSSLQDAGFIGYDCILVKDACATPSPAYVTRAIHYIVNALHGFVVGSRAIKRGLRLATPAGSSVPSSPSKTRSFK